MESLSGMLGDWQKLSFAKRAEEKTKRLLNDPLVQKLRADHPEIDDRTLKISMNRLYQYVTEQRNCAQCPGLDKCPNDFEGHYTRLSVETINGNPYIHDQSVPCSKLLAKQSMDAIRSRIRSFYIDDRALTQGYSIDEIVDIDPERVEAVGSLLRYIRKTQAEGLQKEGLYLVGPFGTGKTFLMCFMLYQLAKSGKSGAIVYMPDFVEDLKSMIQEPHRLKETVELLKETDLLVFDDIGAENLNPWVRDHVMGTILNYRMNRKPTFFTSNHEPSELERHFSFTSKDGDDEFKGQRIMDRIRPFVEVIVVNGTNKRGKAGA
ncbi:primosomal protein DnaI [Paenibacillus flagellatus]|uniref:Primosomal protein DnaI n=1 Tax=Paenibacillus flagellatus TaxID=2211139 RepID=A0A2V5K3L5_9BACL|nr:primosomal protein DnaI [Paenibacillus flagellatus]PYI53849.1 primosomal protein DnaI [Paenibacillus flagellatus]